MVDRACVGTLTFRFRTLGTLVPPYRRDRSWVGPVLRSRHVGRNLVPELSREIPGQVRLVRAVPDEKGLAAFFVLCPKLGQVVLRVEKRGLVVKVGARGQVPRAVVVVLVLAAGARRDPAAVLGAEVGGVGPAHLVRHGPRPRSVVVRRHLRVKQLLDPRSVVTVVAKVLRQRDPILPDAGLPERSHEGVGLGCVRAPPGHKRVTGRCAIRELDVRTGERDAGAGQLVKVGGVVVLLGAWAGIDPYVGAHVVADQEEHVLGTVRRLLRGGGRGFHRPCEGPADHVGCTAGLDVGIVPPFARKMQTTIRE